MLHVRLFRC